MQVPVRLPSMAVHQTCDVATLGWTAMQVLVSLSHPHRQKECRELGNSHVLTANETRPLMGCLHV